MDRNDIQEHPTWAILDSSKLQQYQSCPRKFFFKYVLGWAPNSKSVHLVYGEAWHRAMEILLIQGYNTDAIHNATEIATEYYRRYFSPLSDGERGNKIPGNIPTALAEYIMTYAQDSFKVLFTEISGVVPIREDRLIHFRMDEVDIDPLYGNLITSKEHKTGSRSDAFEEYCVNIQSGTYNHVLFSAFEKEQVYGVIINGTVLYKTKPTFFQRLPARKNEDDMANWLWEVNLLADRLEWDMNELNECSPDDQVMMSFAKNQQFCKQYGRCLFYDHCHAWTNPLPYVDNPPSNFCIDRWDPSEREAKAIFEDGVIKPADEYKKGLDAVSQ